MDAKEFFQAGDVVVNTWGYDQTNVDFFEVVKVSAKFVTLRQIDGEESPDTPAGMYGQVIPAANRTFTGYSHYNKPTHRHSVYLYDGAPHVKFSFGCGKKWDGKPVSYSSWA